MTQVLAWIIPITPSLSVAVGEFELIHILPDNPVLFTIPLSPSYCHQVLIWQDRIIPVLNLAARLALIDDTLQQQRDALIGIYVYQSEEAQQLDYGALLMANTPYQYDVYDQQSCDLPADFISWSYFTSSCFRIDRIDQAVPVLRLERLFASSNTMAS